MGIDIVVPTLGESVTEATVAKWFKVEGDTVAVDEPIHCMLLVLVVVVVVGGGGGGRVWRRRCCCWWGCCCRCC
mgnify:CR=1 FL=1